MSEPGPKAPGEAHAYWGSRLIPPSGDIPYDRDALYKRRLASIDLHTENLGERLQADGIMVDIGTGQGMGANAFAGEGVRRGFKRGAIGIDIDPRGNELPYAVEQAQKEGLDARLVNGSSSLTLPQPGEALFVKGDARTDLLLPDESVDVATSYFTAGMTGVHEVPWREIYGQGARILKRGGLYVVTTEQRSQIDTISQFLTDGGITVSQVEDVPNAHDRYAIIGKKM